MVVVAATAATVYIHCSGGGAGGGGHSLYTVLAVMVVPWKVATGQGVPRFPLINF